MKTSESIIKIIPALLECQKKIEAVTKDAENPYFKSKYADLNSLMEACKDILNTNGILILQPVSLGSVETVLLHTSGEWLSSETKIVSKSEIDPQAQGSAISYARRYGLQSMLFMSAEDDDGEKATIHTTTTPKTTSTPITGDKCPKCGSPMKISLQGKKYCSALCWQKPLPDKVQEGSYGTEGITYTKE
jgi:hypothetical protein